MNPETHTLDVVEIPLPGGCTTRAGLYHTPDGLPEPPRPAIEATV